MSADEEKGTAIAAATPTPSLEPKAATAVVSSGSGGVCNPMCLGIVAAVLAVAGCLLVGIPILKGFDCDDNDDDGSFGTSDDCGGVIVKGIVITVGIGFWIASCIVCCCLCGNASAGGGRNTIVIR
jgi:hypothetical protein